MKFKFLLLMLGVLIGLASCGSTESAEKTEDQKTEAAETPKEQTQDEKIAATDAEVKKIDGMKLKKVKKRYQNPDPEKYYDMAIFNAYYDGDKLMKLEEILGEEGYLSSSHYYFNGDKVFYVLTESSYMDNPYLLRKDYVENDAIFHISGKEKEPEDETKDFNSLKEESYGEKALKNTAEGFKKGLDATITRFKAAKND